MTEEKADGGAGAKVDAAAFFARLGLKPADEKPIMDAWRQANAEWRRQRLRRIAAHAQRVSAHLRRYGGRRPDGRKVSRLTMGRPRPVWCVELRLYFRTLTDAAAFVHRRPSNIAQSIRLGVRCGPFHWVDAMKDGSFPREAAER